MRETSCKSQLQSQLQCHKFVRDGDTGKATDEQFIMFYNQFDWPDR